MLNCTDTRNIKPFSNRSIIAQAGKRQVVSVATCLQTHTAPQLDEDISIVACANFDMLLIRAANSG